MKKIIGICDFCKKEKEAVKDNPNGTIEGWLRLEIIKMMFRPEGYFNYSLNNSNIITISDEKDPDFCSEKCLFDWLKVKIKEIKSPQIEVKK